MRFMTPNSLAPSAIASSSDGGRPIRRIFFAQGAVLRRTRLIPSFHAPHLLDLRLGCKMPTAKKSSSSCPSPPQPSASFVA